MRLASDVTRERGFTRLLQGSWRDQRHFVINVCIWLCVKMAEGRQQIFLKQLKKNRKDEERKGGSGADETFCGVTVVNTFCVPISIGSHQHQSFKTGASLGEPAVLTRSETRRIIFILIAPCPLSIPPPPPSRPRSLRSSWPAVAPSTRGYPCPIYIHPKTCTVFSSPQCPSRLQYTESVKHTRFPVIKTQTQVAGRWSRNQGCLVRNSSILTSEMCMFPFFYDSPSRLHSLPRCHLCRFLRLCPVLTTTDDLTLQQWKEV